METFETGCCPRFKPEGWNHKELRFDDKLFMKDHVKSVFHIPLNFGQVITKDLAKIESAGAEIPDQLVMADEKSPWGLDLYIAVDKEIPQADMEKISGNFLTKVFEGPYRNMGKYIKEMKEYVSSKGKAVKKLYFYYVYCPKCAKAYGENFTVILAEV